MEQRKKFGTTKDEFTYDAERKRYTRTLIEQGPTKALQDVEPYTISTTVQEFDQEQMLKLKEFLESELEQIAKHLKPLREQYNKVKDEKETEKTKRYFRLIDQLEGFRKDLTFAKHLQALNDKKMLTDRIGQLTDGEIRLKGQLAGINDGLSKGPAVKERKKKPEMTADEFAQLMEDERRMNELIDQGMDPAEAARKCNIVLPKERKKEVKDAAKTQ